MPVAYLLGTNFSEFLLPPVGVPHVWKLGGWGQSYFLRNGAASPFYQDPNLGVINHWYVRMQPFGVVYAHADFCRDLTNFLEKFSQKDCPVDGLQEILVATNGNGYQFMLNTMGMAAPIAISNRANAAYNARAPAPTPKIYSQGITAKACSCGAAKTYQAVPGSSLHSGWCEVAKK